MTALRLISSKMLLRPHSPPRHLYTSSKHAKCNKNVCPWIGHLFYVGFPLGSFKYQRPFATIIRPLPASHCSCTLLVSHLFKIWPSLKITPSGHFICMGQPISPPFVRSRYLIRSHHPSAKRLHGLVIYHPQNCSKMHLFYCDITYDSFPPPFSSSKSSNLFLMEPLVNMFR